ncbi:MAG: hypothetical protein ABSE49_31785 [Polyangiaceae bacterium]|jgi:hypothetical protein
MSRLRPVFGLAVVLAGTLVSGAARAQTASGPTITASGQPYPNRILPNNQNLGYSTRAQNLNPLGISYTDCTSDQTLQFSVTLSGFTGSDTFEVWASLTSDCTAMTDRGIGATAAICWEFPANKIVDPLYTTPVTEPAYVRVQDLVGWQQNPPGPATNQDPPTQGIAACSAQPSFAAVPININFLAIDSSGNSDGTPYQYTINTDMVGPPAPTGVSETVGDTIYNVSWTANSDSDTAGYDIYIDPIPGHEDAGAGSVDGGTAGQVMVCPDTGVAPIGDADGDDGPLESSIVDTGVVDTGASDGYVAPLPYDGGCYAINKGGTPVAAANGYTCNDSVLASGVTLDGGLVDGATTTTTTTEYDDAGNIIESEAGIEEGSGGISTIPSQYLINGSSGFTIADKAVGSYTIKGLLDYTTYTVVVAAVDGTGNVGPPSLEVCDFPAPVKDFWETYQEDGGRAGGFCALETIGTGGASSLAGIAGVLGFAALVRRRRRGGK